MDDVDSDVAIPSINSFLTIIPYEEQRAILLFTYMRHCPTYTSSITIYHPPWTLTVPHRKGLKA